MQMYQVDAFTDKLFAGNPAAVLVLVDWLDDDLMLNISQENNLAETAFLRARGDGSWDLRWFSPFHEVDFCGHATLASAHVLLTEKGADPPFVFNTRVGELRVTGGSPGYRLDVPRLEPEILGALPSEIAGVFVRPPKELFRNFENIFAVLDSAEDVRQFVPELTSIARLGPIGLVVTGQENRDGRADFVSRYFAPGAGIPEDPVTGSIHATLVPYWAGQLGTSKLLAFQASARGGWLECELAGERVLLTGSAVTYMKATISLPNEGFESGN